MAFGEHTGRPASKKQVTELLTLLHGAGHSDFRDARGPMGFTQRQAAGKFTSDEVASFIDRLLEQAEGDHEAPLVTPPRRVPVVQRPLGRICAEDLAAELTRRGWTVSEPTGAEPGPR